jgi:hypothetical protein
MPIPYARSIRSKLESLGYLITEISADGKFSVTATKSGKNHIAIADNLTVVYLEIERSIRGSM